MNIVIIRRLVMGDVQGVATLLIIYRSQPLRESRVPHIITGAVDMAVILVSVWASLLANRGVSDCSLHVPLPDTYRGPSFLQLSATTDSYRSRAFKGVGCVRS